MDIPPSALTAYGLPGVVILLLVGILATVVRSLFNRKILPLSHHVEIVGQYREAITERDETIRLLRSDRDKWAGMAGSLSEQNAELLTNQDLTLSAWNSIKAYVAAKERDL